MKRLAILIAVAFAGAVGLACLVFVLLVFGDLFAPARAPRDTVQGVMVDRDSGAPLSGVSLVCIAGYPLSFFEHRDGVKSDEQGRYTPIQHKDYVVEVRKHGYEPKKISWMPRQVRHKRKQVIRLTPHAGGTS